MQTYDEMVDSGVEWLAKIPKQWKLTKIGYIANIDTGNSIKDEEKQKFEDNVDARPYISSKDINADTALASYNNGIYIPRNNNKFKVAPKGSTLLCIEGGSAGRKITYTSQEVSYVNKLCNFNAKKANQKFLYYYLRSRPFKSEFNLNITGLIGGVSKTKLASFKMALPSSDTQQKIADFLDQETAKIDNLIAKQERLLELLEEKRRATITHAVTRGLNPHVELKETNIPWLGQIPAHWELYRAKYLFEKSQEKPYDTDEVVTAFRDGEVVLRKLRREEGFTFADKEIGYQHVRVGDLVIHAMDAFAGAVGVSKSEGKMSPVCSICRPIRPDVSTEYFAQLVRAMTSTNYLVAIAKGIRERSTDFRFGDFSNMTFPLPPIEEQKNIVSKINSENEKVAVLKKKIQTQIKLLKERRTSLISHAVTGKIKI